MVFLVTLMLGELEAGRVCSVYFNQITAGRRNMSRPQPTAIIGLWAISSTGSSPQPPLVTYNLRVYYCRTYYIAVCGGLEGDSEGHVLWGTTSRDICGLVCPSHTSEREGKGYCVKGGWREGEDRVKKRVRRSVNPLTVPASLRLVKKPNLEFFSKLKKRRFFK